MGKGLITKYHQEDDYLIEKYDIHTIALEYNDSLTEIENWRTNKILWAITMLRVRSNLMKGGK